MVSHYNTFVTNQHDEALLGVGVCCLCFCLCTITRSKHYCSGHCRYVFCLFDGTLDVLFLLCTFAFVLLVCVMLVGWVIQIFTFVAAVTFVCLDLFIVC